jgi:hypothetical protein
MVGRWFFMIIGTIFSITPAFVYWLAGTLAANGDPSAPTADSVWQPEQWSRNSTAPR